MNRAGWTLLLVVLSTMTQGHQLFEMPHVPKRTDPGATVSSANREVRGMILPFAGSILLVTYLVEKHTRRRRDRPLFHLLICGHIAVGLFLFFNYIKQC